MSFDWIKMRCCLPDEPEVVGMAHSLKVTPEHVCGALLRVWGLGDSHAVSRSCPDATGTNEGFLSRYSAEEIDKRAGLNGFAAAMASERWLSIYSDGVAFPEWDEHHSKSAKQRASEQKKKRKQRQKSPTLSPTCPDATGTKQGTREREEKKVNTETPLPPFDSDRFRQAWGEWEKSRREIGKPLKPTAIKLQYADLSKLGEERAIAALLHSAKNGYQGIYEPKGGEQKTQQGDRFSANINAAADAIKNMQSREEKPP